MEQKSPKTHLPGFFDWRIFLTDVIETGQIAFARDAGYYPTPEQIVEMMIDAADFQPNELFFEPSAGRGNILKAVRELSLRKNLDLQIFACELNPRFVAELRGDNFLVAAGDFLSFDAVEKADKILMNPPFGANGSGIKHSLHAFRHLKPGGKMIVLTRADVDKGQTRWHDEWNKLCASYRTASHDLPSASFKEVGTLVETKISVFLKEKNERNFG